MLLYWPVILSGIYVKGKGVTLDHNLVTMAYWVGGYFAKPIPQNFEFTPGIDGVGASDLKMSDNVVAGSQRCGYWLKGNILIFFYSCLIQDNRN